jgi:hypothetical protein
MAIEPFELHDNLSWREGSSRPAASSKQAAIVGVAKDRTPKRTHEPHLIGHADIGTRSAERREIDDHGVAAPGLAHPGVTARRFVAIWGPRARKSDPRSRSNNVSIPDVITARASLTGAFPVISVAGNNC